jgi:O-antigen ligase
MIDDTSPASGAVVAPRPSDGARRRLALVFFGLACARVTLTDHPPALVDAALLASFAALVALALRADRDLAVRAPVGVLTVLTLAVLGSAASSWHPLVSFSAASAAIGAFAAALGAAALAARAATLWALALGGALNAAAGGVQRFVTWPDALARAKRLNLDEAALERLQSMRPLGLSLSPDLFGALCLIGAGAGLALAADRRTPARAVPALLALVCVVGAVLSRSAGVALALGVLVVALAVLSVAGRARPGLAVLTGAVGLVVPVGLMLAFGRGSAQLATSAGERLLNWRIGASAALDQPLFGAGWGRFAAAYTQHRTPDANVTRYAHSLPVQLLTEAGLVFGGVIALLLLLALLAALRRRVTSTPSLSRDAVVATLVAAAARTTFDYDAQIAQTAAALALLFVVAWLDGQDDGPVFAASVAPRTVGRRTRLSAALVAAWLVLGLSSAAWLNARDAALSPFRRDTAPPGPPDVERALDWSTTWPSDPHAAALAARVLGERMNRCGEEAAGGPPCDVALDDATQAAERWRALRHPPPEVELLRAQVAWQRDDDDAVAEALASALRLDPGHRGAHGVRLAWGRQRSDERLRAWEYEAARWGVE